MLQHAPAYRVNASLDLQNFRQRHHGAHEASVLPLAASCYRCIMHQGLSRHMACSSISFSISMTSACPHDLNTAISRCMGGEDCRVLGFNQAPGMLKGLGAIHSEQGLTYGTQS